MKIAELKKRQVGDIGFINTYLIDATQVKFHAADTEANLLQSLVINENKDILPPFLNIGCIVFGTEIKERMWRKKFTSFGRDYT